MVCSKAGKPLRLVEREMPEPEKGQVRVRVLACGVCRTDLHLVDGELPDPKPDVVPGHEVVGRVDAVGENVSALQVGDRVGIPWLGWSCGQCSFCREGRENLCGQARFTGYTLDGGFAEYTVADARYCLPLPGEEGEVSLAPLLCAGLIGYRCLRMTGESSPLGLYGFGAAAHIVAQVARHQGRKLFAFTRPGDKEGQAFARRLGADWAGASGDAPPEPMESAIIFAPVGSLVVDALRQLKRGGIVVCGGIHMSPIPEFPYRLLWEERRISSVANLTRRDGTEFLPLARQIPVRTETTPFALEQANEALAKLREGSVQGAAVLVPGASEVRRGREEGKA